ncbi:hypothetical protein B0H10DRAFT_1985213 [Mycena sp. CBHHK59/15]|nr:hypothetical protein B0H10DRAFT_1985213 [Mycena sp. CBHHK59/15]
MPYSILKRSAPLPPSPTLTRTFSAHSPAAYDRSPIQVTPNSCALPARGCPGRTYYALEDCPAPSHPSLSASTPHNQKVRGHLHPRALARQEAAHPTPSSSASAFTYNHNYNDAYAVAADPDDSERTPTRTAPLPLPPLIPDLSSESDESDGFTSPPPAVYAAYYQAPAAKYPSPSFSYPAYPAAPYGYPAVEPQPQPQPQQRRRRARRAPVDAEHDDGYDEEEVERPTTPRLSPTYAPSPSYYNNSSSSYATASANSYPSYSYAYAYSNHDREPDARAPAFAFAPSSPPTAARPPRSKTPKPPAASSPPGRPSSSSAPVREPKDARESKPTKEKRSPCRLRAALSRTGTGFAFGVEGEGCLGGF